MRKNVYTYVKSKKTNEGFWYLSGCVFGTIVAPQVSRQIAAFQPPASGGQTRADKEDADIHCILVHLSYNKASFQNFNLEKWAQTLGGLNFSRAFRSEDKQWFWDLRPSI